MNAERDSPKFSQEVLSGELYGGKGQAEGATCQLFPNLTYFGPKKISKKGKAKYTHSNLCSYVFPQYQFSSVQFSRSAVSLCNPMNCSTPGFPVHHHLQDFTQTHIHLVSDAIQPSHPLSSPSPPAPIPPSIRVQSTGVSVLASFLPNKSQG